jgi:hypothetical protein
VKALRQSANGELVLMQSKGDHGCSLMIHPLDEPQQLSAPITTNSSASWQDEGVIWTSTELPYLATYSKVTRKTPARQWYEYCQGIRTMLAVCIWPLCSIVAVISDGCS